MTIIKFFRAAIAISALFVGLTQTAQADIVTWTGDTTGGPTFDRPVEDLSGLSQFGVDVAYNAIAFTVDESGEYSFTMHGLGFDTFLVLYQTAFNPNDSLSNAVIASDDLLNVRTSGFADTLTAGTLYFAVVTGFEPVDVGMYSLTISGEGMITAVPEPSTWLMLGLGLAAMGYAARRQSLPK